MFERKKNIQRLVLKLSKLPVKQAIELYINPDVCIQNIFLFYEITILPAGTMSESMHVSLLSFLKKRFKMINSFRHDIYKKMYLVNSLFHFQNDNLRLKFKSEMHGPCFVIQSLSVLSSCGAYLKMKSLCKPI